MNSTSSTDGTFRIAGGHKGFSLLELMLAIAVFTVGVLAVGTIQVKSIKTTDTAKYVSEDLSVASAMLERMAALDYNHPDLTDPDGIFDDDGVGELDNPDFVRQFGRYTVSWEIFENYMGTSPALPAKRISMTVSWKGDGGQTRTHRFEFVKVLDN